MKYMMHIKQYKMINNTIILIKNTHIYHSFCAFSMHFMHVFYAHFDTFVKGYYEPDIKITGI
jgi:hypothetical protein